MKSLSLLFSLILLSSIIYVTMFSSAASPITIVTDKSSYIIGESVSVSGIATANAQISIQVYDAVGNRVIVAQAQASSDGKYSALNIWKIKAKDVSGTWRITAYDSISKTTAEAQFTVYLTTITPTPSPVTPTPTNTFTPTPTSTPTPTVTPTPTLTPTVTPTPSPIESIILSVSPTSIKKGESVTVSGFISFPVSDAVISLIYIKAGEVKVVRLVTASGNVFTDRYNPDSGGSWSVKAFWEGDAKNKGAESNLVAFEVVDKGCLIATSTYGSLLAPEVQFLRGFRESIVYNTFAGSSFMNVFNGWYYSFSPNIATSIEQYSGVKPAMRIILTPLLEILKISSATYSLLDFNHELGIVMTGFIAGSLIGIVYFSPLTAATLLTVRLSKKPLPKAETVCWLLLPLAASLALILTAELMNSSLLMMASTGAFIVFTVAFVSGFVSLKAVRLKL